MEILVSFGEGMRVDARFRDHVVHTDQPKHVGGDDSAPSPLELFLTSLATCAGLYVLRFCQQRNISTEGMSIVQVCDRDPDTTMFTRVGIEIRLPADFPPQYKEAVVRAANHCAVKKHLQHPPQIEVYTTQA